MNYIIYSIKGRGQDLEAEGVIYKEKSAKGALDAFVYKNMGRRIFDRKTLVAIPSKMIQDGQKWTALSKRYRDGKNIKVKDLLRRRNIKK